MMKRIVAIIITLCSSTSISAQLNVDAVIDAGRSSLYYEDYVTAIARFNDVLLIRPNRADVLYYRAYAKFSLEDYASAELDCSQSINLNPFRPEFYQLRGLCRINRENYVGAIEDYSHVLSELPDDQGARYNRALCQMELKDFNAAEYDLSHLRTINPRMSRAYLVSAQISLEQRDTLKGINWVDSLLRINPYEVDALSFRGRYCLTLNQYSLADSLLTQAITHGGLTADNYIARAQARHGMNRFNDALCDYDMAIRQVPDHFVGHYNRGLLRALMGADNDAILDFNFVLELEPDNTLALYNRALLLERVGDYAGAERDFTLLITQYPTFYNGYASRARCRRRQGKHNLAVQDETVVRRANLDITFGKNQNRQPVKEVRRRSEHDLDHYQELLEVERDSTRHYISEVAGRIQNRTADQNLLPVMQTEEAHSVLEESPDNSGAKAQIRYNRGCQNAAVGLVDNAIDDFTEAIRLDARLGEAWYNRGLLYMQKGDNSRAAKDFSMAGELGIYQSYNHLKQLRRKKL